MSTRLSFYDVPQLKGGVLEELATKVSTNRFTSRASTGFLVDRISARRLDARFVVKVLSVDELTDPLGRKYTQETVSYSEQRFVLQDTYPNLVVYNPNHAFTLLSGRLLEFSDFQISLIEFAWQPEKVFTFLEERARPARVYAAKVDGISLGKGVEARMSIEGGGDDIRAQARSYFKSKPMRFTSLKAEFEYARQRRKCEIRADGGVTIFGEFDPAFVDLWIEIAAEAANGR